MVFSFFLFLFICAYNVMVFSRQGLVNYLPGLASNHNPPDIGLLSSLITGVSTSTWLCLLLAREFLHSTLSALLAPWDAVVHSALAWLSAVCPQGWGGKLALPVLLL
jgi:hypothetical protein